MLFLHLSDIHFNAEKILRPYEADLGLRGDLIHDVEKMRAEMGRPIDAILISGDIAYHGWQTEYEFALTWLRDELCPTAGCALEQVFVIPGNHDVDRKASASPMHKAARDSLRGTAMHKANTAIIAYVDDDASSEMMFKPIENHNRFAANFLCEIGKYQPQTDRKPYAMRDFPMSDGSTLRVWGFNSVLVCDAADAKEMMFVDPSAAQIVAREDGVTHLVMCHHPFNWLRNGTEFRQRIEEVSHVHLFGHEHTLRVEEYRHFTRIRAGAVQPDRDEPGWKPGYNIIDLTISDRGGKRALDVKVWVRHLDGARFVAGKDRNDRDPWELAHTLGPWRNRPPAVLPVPAAESEPVHVAEHEEMAKLAATVRSVALKILAMREFDQRKIITGLDLHEDGDQKLLDYEFAIAAVKRASTRGILEKLNDAIDNYNRTS